MGYENSGSSIIAFGPIWNYWSREHERGKEDIQVTGRIYVMGNEPFTQVAIQLDDGKVYALIGEYDKDLRALQGKRVTVSGKLSGKTSRGAEAIEVKSFQSLETK